LPLSDLRVAVNLRTAAHLGLRFTPRQQREFDLVFPSP
jgi:putative ABC transport system substrate-binding protein